MPGLWSSAGVRVESQRRLGRHKQQSKERLIGGGGKQSDGISSG